MAVLGKEIKLTLHLALPLIASELALSINNFIVTWFVAKLGKEALAATSLAMCTYFTLVGTCWGIIAAVGVLTANHYGAKNPNGVKAAVRQGFLLAIFLCALVMVLMIFYGPFIRSLGQSVAVTALSVRLAHYFVWSLVPDLLFFVLQQFVTGISRPRIILVSNIICSIMTTFFNYVFLFGAWGFPKLGVVGLGVSAVISYWIVFVFFVLYIFHDKGFMAYQIFEKKIPKFDRKIFTELWRIGWPIGAVFAMEIGSFAAMSSMMGQMSTVALASQQIVMQYLGLVIMVVFGLSQATTIRVGQAVGARQYQSLKSIGHVGILLSLIFMSFVSAVYWFWPHSLVALDVSPQSTIYSEIVGNVVRLLSVVAVFQIIECVRLVASGVLRGMKDTVFPMIVTFIAFWVIGLPLGYLFGFHFHLGGQGIWEGVTLGVLVGAALLFWRFHHKVSVFSLPVIARSA